MSLNLEQRLEKFCKCGCGEKCKKLFLRGHQIRINHPTKGKKVSDFFLERMSKLHKGKILSKETRLKISEKLKGKKLSEETKIKIGEKSRNISKETKFKMSISQRKRFSIKENHPFFGKHHSENGKKLISEKNKGRKITEYHKLCIIKAHKGSKRSEETKKRIGLSTKGKIAGSKHHFYGKHHTQETKIKIALNKKSTHTKGKFSYKGFSFDSSWEVKYAKYLDSKGIPWIRNTKRIWLIDDKGVFSYTPDFIVDGKFVEVKGYYGERTIRIIKALPSAGVKVEFLGRKELTNLGINLKDKSSILGNRL